LFDSHKWFYVYHRIDGPEDVYNFVVSANKENFNVVSISVGLDKSYLELLRRFKRENLRVDFITLDIAHSHTEKIRRIIPETRYLFPDAYIIVGNGCTEEWVRFLQLFPINAIKVGIGVSNACRTRQYTGFGSQTATDLYKCSEVFRGFDVISDGGLTVTNNEVWIGDVAKAIVLGADMVMSGSLFSRCIDSPAIVHGYYGNASRDAKEHTNHIEGTTLKIETNGLTIKEMMKLISDSLKSSVSYGGGTCLKDLRMVQYEVL
jgi:GMP reductase